MSLMDSLNTELILEAMPDWACRETSVALSSSTLLCGFLQSALLNIVNRCVTLFNVPNMRKIW